MLTQSQISGEKGRGGEGAKGDAAQLIFSGSQSESRLSSVSLMANAPATALQNGWTVWLYFHITRLKEVLSPLTLLLQYEVHREALHKYEHIIFAVLFVEQA